MKKQGYSIDLIRNYYKILYEHYSQPLNIGDTVTKPKWPLLLSAGADAEKVARTFLFVICDRFSAFPRDARIKLVVPGMETANLDILREELLEWLIVSLPNSQEAFQVDIIEHPRTGEPEIVVPIDDTYVVASKLVDAVHKMVANHLVPFAGEQDYREVVLLRENQRLVPLNFYLTDYGTKLVVKLPESLELRQPNRPTGRKYSHDPRQRTHDFLQDHLGMALDFWKPIINVAVYLTEEGGAQIELLFSEPLLIESNAPARLQNAILCVLDGHSIAPHSNTELVFAGTYQENPSSRFC